MYQAGGSGKADYNRELLSIKEVAELLHRSPASIYRDIAAGVMPKPLKVGHSTRWRRSVLLQWLEDDCPPCT